MVAGGGGAPAWIAIAGLAAILWSALTYSPATAFPGVAALVPTLGTALVILAGDVRLGFFRGLNARVLTWIGDRSYSIYLWHWPLVVFYTVRQEKVGLMDGIGLIALTMLLSHLSYEYLEQRYRHAKVKGEWKPLGYGLASIAACVAAAGTLQYSVASQATIHIDAADPRYPGPAALLAAAPVPEGVEAIPALAALKRDLPRIYVGDACHQNQVGAEPISCTLGNPDGARTMVITGDSHAAQWVPALERIAHANGWRLVTFTKSACAFSRVEVRLRNEPYASCMEWRENVIAEIKALRPDVVFTSQSRYGYIARETMVEGLRSVWRELAEAGIKVVPIHDTPWMPFQPGDCLALGKPENCTAPRSKVEASDIFADAASALEGIGVIDLTDAICDPANCETIIGNMIVWRDQHHLTATYAAALAPYLAQQAGLPFSGSAAHVAEAGRRKGNTDIIFARLTCSALKQGNPIERDVELQLENGKIAYRSGDWKKQKERYDLWTGTVRDGSVTMTGHYVEGAGGVKQLSLSGTIVDGRLRLEGKRGPRDCVLSADWPGPRA